MVRLLLVCWICYYYTDALHSVTFLPGVKMLLNGNRSYSSIVGSRRLTSVSKKAVTRLKLRPIALQIVDYRVTTWNARTFLWYTLLDNLTIQR